MAHERSRPASRLALVFIDRENFVGKFPDRHNRLRWLDILHEQVRELVFSQGFLTLQKPRIYVTAKMAKRYNNRDGQWRWDNLFEFVAAPGDYQAVDRAIISDIISAAAKIDPTAPNKPDLFLWSGDGDYLEVLCRVRDRFNTIHVVSWDDSLHSGYRRREEIALHMYSL